MHPWPSTGWHPDDDMGSVREAGLEPATSSLSGMRSDLLSYTRNDQASGNPSGSRTPRRIGRDSNPRWGDAPYRFSEPARMAAPQPIHDMESGRRDSNPRLLRSERSTLPGCATTRIKAPVRAVTMGYAHRNGNTANGTENGTRVPSRPVCVSGVSDMTVRMHPSSQPRRDSNPDPRIESPGCAEPCTPRGH